MSISDEAVEAAAVAVRAAAWGHISPEEAAREILEAAAPHLMVQALEEAVDAFPLETIHAPDTALVWLMRRAEDMRRPWNTGGGE